MGYDGRKDFCAMVDGWVLNDVKGIKRVRSLVYLFLDFRGRNRRRKLSKSPTISALAMSNYLALQ